MLELHLVLTGSGLARFIHDPLRLGIVLGKKMAANSLSLSFITPLSCSSSSILKHKPQFAGAAKRFVSYSAPLSFYSVHFPQPRLACVGTIFFLRDAVPREPYSSSPSLRAGCSGKSGLCASLSAVVAEGIDGGEYVGRENDDVSDEEEQRKLETACEVYVCNLPRSCDAAQLLDMFKPHGTILSVEVCRNAETGESKGSGYVTMASINSARNAITALDGLDVGGREMRVRFSVEMNPGRRNPETMNSSPERVIYYEAPYKLYVGNLARGVRPEDLRYLFSRFGTVASVRVLIDRKQSKSRVYAFISFLLERERDAAMSLNGTEFCGRTLVVREGVEKAKL